MAANQDIHHGQTGELAPVKHGHDHATTEQNIQHFQYHWAENLIYNLRRRLMKITAWVYQVLVQDVAVR